MPHMHIDGGAGMKLSFPFWVGQVDTESLPPWCAVVLLATVIVAIVLMVIAIVREVQE